MELPALDHAGLRSFSLAEAHSRGRGEASGEVDGFGGGGVEGAEEEEGRG